MEDFFAYSENFIDHTRVIQDNIQKMEFTSGERKKQLFRETDREIVECESILSKMEDFKRRYPEETMTFRPKIRSHSQELNELKKQLKKVNFDGNSGLLSANNDNLELWNEKQRYDILGAYDTQKKTDKRIDHSIDIAKETEEMAKDTLDLLEGQGRQLKNANDNLDYIDENMSRSNKIMRQMYYKVLSNKILLILFICVELVAILIIVYFKWIKDLFN
eukprot:TRINITY_DN1498_c0_g1_i1.p1 TRINITY_DN1498_c0_g1~~TRINITY_DN1498_c0_g1_i1.p1  ORF type:complete len:219 (-),score=55.06 TRINITY_DN1498_c0_g1_i1:156-812(-)